MTKSLLTNEDKLGIANSHKRNLDYNLYNAEMSLLTETAVDLPNSEAVMEIEKQIADLNKKISAIEAIITSLSEKE